MKNAAAAAQFAAQIVDPTDVIARGFAVHELQEAGYSNSAIADFMCAVMDAAQKLK